MSKMDERSTIEKDMSVLSKPPKDRDKSKDKKKDKDDDKKKSSKKDKDDDKKKSKKKGDDTDEEDNNKKANQPETGRSNQDPEERPNPWKLDEPFRSRLVGAQQIIYESLLPKKDFLKAQKYRINYRVKEISYVKGIIERDIRNEFLLMLERLNSAEGTKIALLDHDSSELERDIERIDGIYNQFNSLTNDLLNKKVEYGEFLGRYGDLNELIEFSNAKPFKTTIDVTPNDLPRELTERKKDLQKIKYNKELLEFKDEVIKKVVKNYTEDRDKLVEDMTKASDEEVKEWATLTDKFSTELSKQRQLTTKLVMNTMSKNIEQKAVPIEKLEALFKDVDPNLSGIVSREQFEHIVVENARAGNIELEALFDLFDPKNEDRVSYFPFLRIVSDPESLDKVK